MVDCERCNVMVSRRGLLICVTDSLKVRFIWFLCDVGMAENDVRSKEKTILTWKYSTQLITSAACLTGLSKDVFLGGSMVKMQH